MRRVFNQCGVAAAALSCAQDSFTTTTTTSMRACSEKKKPIVVTKDAPLTDYIDAKTGLPKGELTPKQLEELYFIRKDDMEKMEAMYKESIPTEVIDGDVSVMNLPPKKAAPRSAGGGGEEDGFELDIFGEKVAPVQPSDLTVTPNEFDVSTKKKGDTHTILNDDLNTTSGALGKYRRTTLSYVSNTEPDRIMGLGMGAGFGATEDKRLGFLRPKQENPYLIQKVPDPEDENKDLAHLPEEERQKVLAPKTPEEKRIAKQRELRKHQEQIAQSLQKMNAFKGTTFSPNEHFLLVDLDFDRDSLLFGNTREEFEMNVSKMKKVIVEYTHWERRDTFYLWGTWVLKAFFVYAMYDTWLNYRVKTLLADSFDDFTTVVAEDIENLRSKRDEDFERARLELKERAPDFTAMRATIEAERKRYREEKAAAHAEVTSLGAKRTTYHPMDTSGSEEADENARMEKMKTDLMKFTELSTSKENPISQHYEGNAGEVDPNKRASTDKDGHSILGATWGLVKKVATFEGFRQSHKSNLPGSNTPNATTPTNQQDPSAPQDEDIAKKAASFTKPLRTVTPPTIPRTAAEKQEEDEAVLARLSYAVAPTSIEAVKAIRRIILPRSDDFALIVRKEMLDYKNMKLANMTYPREESA